MSAEVFSPKPQRPHKRALSDIDPDASPVSKYARRSTPPLPTPSTHGQRSESPHPPRRSTSRSLEDLDPRSAPPKKRRRLQSPHFKPTDDQHHQITRSGSAPPWPTCAPGNKYCHLQLPTNSLVDAWISTIFNPDPRRPVSPPSDRPSTCPATVDVSKDNRTPPSLATLKQMSRQPSQYAESVGPRSNSSSTNKPPGTSDAAYIDTLFGHGIIMDPSGRNIPKALEPLKERILQKRSSPQLDDEAVFDVMDTAAELAYSSEGPTNKILRTPMFPLGYAGLAEGGNTQWNAIALPNNPKCDNKLSAPKPDAYLAYSRGQKSPWTVEQNNVVNHCRVRPYSQPAKRNTFPSISFELKAESAGGVLTTAEAQAAGSGSHSVNAMLWLLEEAKAAGLTEVDLMKDTVSFSIVASHRQAVAYLHWLEPEAKHFYMSYLRSYSTFEADAIRGCNNTIKNMIDNANGPRKIKIGNALVTLEPLIHSWNPQPVGTNPPTPNHSFSGEPRPRKRGRGS